MPMPDASTPVAADHESLRDALVRGNATLARIGPILAHLMATPDHSLFSDEIIARIRGMCHHLAWHDLPDTGPASTRAG